MNSLSDQMRIQAARSDAIEYLSYGAKTSGKIIRKLQSKAYETEIIKATLESLNADGYIKDEIIIRANWRNRSGGRREAVRAFCHRMAKLGISKKTLDRFLSEYPPYETDKVSILEYLEAKFATELEILPSMETQSLERQKILRKIIQNASSRGYQYQTILDGLRAYAILLHV